jgi:hypothetical protein
MSEPDQTTTLTPDAPIPPAAPAVAPAYVANPAPRFRDQVMGMRSVIAVALAMVIIGGLSGFLLGERTNVGNDGFGRGPGGFPGGQRVFPGGPQGVPGQPGQQPFNGGQQPFSQGQQQTPRQ